VAASAQPGCSGALFDVLMEGRRREIIEKKEALHRTGQLAQLTGSS
jgi:hypothetical protein